MQIVTVLIRSAPHFVTCPLYLAVVDLVVVVVVVVVVVAVVAVVLVSDWAEPRAEVRSRLPRRRDFSRLAWVVHAHSQTFPTQMSSSHCRHMHKQQINQSINQSINQRCRQNVSI